MKEEKFELEKRREGIGPLFVDFYMPGDKIEPWEIAPGNRVTLKCDGITLIADVSDKNGEIYKGVIIGFEQYLEEYLHGKRAGDEITFGYQHIIGCSRK